MTDSNSPDDEGAYRPTHPWGQPYAESAGMTEHQTGSAPQTPASPPSTSPPVVDLSQPRRRRTSGRMALAFSLTGVFCCGVPALIGMFMGRSELLAIKDGKADPDGEEAARAAFYVGLGATLLYAAIVTIWVLMILAFRDSELAS